MKYFTIIGMLLMNFSLLAQDYNEAIGFRLGVSSGIVYKNFADDERALEVMINFERGGAQLIVVRQYHQPILLDLTNQLFFYYGFGGRIGYARWSDTDYFFNAEVYRKKQFSMGLGFDLNLGFEYHAVKYPVVFGIDYKPYFSIEIPLNFRRNYYNFSVSMLYSF